MLDLSAPEVDPAQVRNYEGKERYIPRLLLQPLTLPWGGSYRWISSTRVHVCSTTPRTKRKAGDDEDEDAAQTGSEET